MQVEIGTYLSLALYQQAGAFKPRPRDPIEDVLVVFVGKGKGIAAGSTREVQESPRECIAAMANGGVLKFNLRGTPKRYRKLLSP